MNLPQQLSVSEKIIMIVFSLYKDLASLTKENIKVVKTYVYLKRVKSVDQ